MYTVRRVKWNNLDSRTQPRSVRIILQGHRLENTKVLDQILLTILNSTILKCTIYVRIIPWICIKSYVFVIFIWKSRNLTESYIETICYHGHLYQYPIVLYPEFIFSVGIFIFLHSIATCWIPKCLILWLQDFYHFLFFAMFYATVAS